MASSEGIAYRWEAFNRWCDEYADRHQGMKPKVEDVRRWHRENAEKVWPDSSERPSVFLAVSHNKGRRVRGHKTCEYYKRYRAGKAAEQQLAARLQPAALSGRRILAVTAAARKLNTDPSRSVTKRSFEDDDDAPVDHDLQGLEHSGKRRRVPFLPRPGTGAHGHRGGRGAARRSSDDDLSEDPSWGSEDVASEEEDDSGSGLATTTSFPSGHPATALGAHRRSALGGLSAVSLNGLKQLQAGVHVTLVRRDSDGRTIKVQEQPLPQAQVPGLAQAQTGPMRPPRGQAAGLPMPVEYGITKPLSPQQHQPAQQQQQHGYGVAGGPLGGLQGGAVGSGTAAGVGASRQGCRFSTADGVDGTGITSEGPARRRGHGVLHAVGCRSGGGNADVEGDAGQQSKAEAMEVGGEVEAAAGQGWRPATDGLHRGGRSRSGRVHPTGPDEGEEAPDGQDGCGGEDACWEGGRGVRHPGVAPARCRAPRTGMLGQQPRRRPEGRTTTPVAAVRPAPSLPRSSRDSTRVAAVGSESDGEARRKSGMVSVPSAKDPLDLLAQAACEALASPRLEDETAATAAAVVDPVACPAVAGRRAGPAAGGKIDVDDAADEERPPADAWNGEDVGGGEGAAAAGRGRVIASRRRSETICPLGFVKQDVVMALEQGQKQQEQKLQMKREFVDGVGLGCDAAVLQGPSSAGVADMKAEAEAAVCDVAQADADAEASAQEQLQPGVPTSSRVALPGGCDAHPTRHVSEGVAAACIAGVPNRSGDEQGDATLPCPGGEAVTTSSAVSCDLVVPAAPAIRAEGVQPAPYSPLRLLASGSPSGVGEAPAACGAIGTVATAPAVDRIAAAAPGLDQCLAAAPACVEGAAVPASLEAALAILQPLPGPPSAASVLPGAAVASAGGGLPPPLGLDPELDVVRLAALNASAGAPAGPAAMAAAAAAAAALLASQQQQAQAAQAAAQQQLAAAAAGVAMGCTGLPVMGQVPVEAKLSALASAAGGDPAVQAAALYSQLAAQPGLQLWQALAGGAGAGLCPPVGLGLPVSGLPPPTAAAAAAAAAPYLAAASAPPTLLNNAGYVGGHAALLPMVRLLQMQAAVRPEAFVGAAGTMTGGGSDATAAAAAAAAAALASHAACALPPALMDVSGLVAGATSPPHSMAVVARSMQPSR